MLSQYLSDLNLRGRRISSSAAWYLYHQGQSDSEWETCVQTSQRRSVLLLLGQYNNHHIYFQMEQIQTPGRARLECENSAVLLFPPCSTPAVALTLHLSKDSLQICCSFTLPNWLQLCLRFHPSHLAHLDF